MSEPFEIAVVGAGITGLAFAAGIAARAGDLRVTVVDAGEQPQPALDDGIDLRVSAISAGSAMFLTALGAWQRIDPSRACAYEHMRVWDERDMPDSDSALRFDAAEFGVQQLGTIVENRSVQAALLQVLREAGVPVRFDSPVQAMRQQGRRYRLELGDKRTLSADLVIGADGAGSYVRSAADIDTHRWPYEQTAFVTHLATEKPHRHTAWQRFLEDGPLGILPLADGRVSVVWSTTPDTAARALDATDTVLGRMLTDASDHVLGELTVAGPRGSFPLAAQHADRYVLPGIALIGDAAHAIHPLAGQGANLGLQDASTLAEVIVAALAHGEFPADRPVLRRYERARRGANSTMLHFMTALNRLFSNDSAALAGLRMTGMRLFNHSGPIRERVVRVALGVG